MAEATTTAHTCGGPKFGRKTPGCPRCDELLGGAAARDRFGPRPATAAGTKHSPECSPPGRGPGFRRTPGCPRCDELSAGAAPREAHGGIDAIRRNAANERQTLESIRTHDCRTAGCGPVCTAHDW